MTDERIAEVLGFGEYTTESTKATLTAVAHAIEAEVRKDDEALIEQCRAALAEELAAWDIDPPLQHVKDAHDAGVARLGEKP